MAPCPHSVLFCVAGSELRDGRAESPKSSLPFRPGTSCRLEVLKQGSLFLIAKLVVDGDAGGLLASVWTETMDGHLIGEKHNVLVNTWHFTCSTKPERRIYGRVWSEKCALCEKQREEERASSYEWESISDFLAKEGCLVTNEPPQAPTQHELQARDKQLEDELGGKNRELTARGEENEWLKSENVELHAEMAAERKKSVGLGGDVADGKLKLAAAEEENKQLKERNELLTAENTALIERIKAAISKENAADLHVLAARHNNEQLAAHVLEFAKGHGGRFDLFVADPIQSLLPEAYETYKKIVEFMKRL